MSAATKPELPDAGPGQRAAPHPHLVFIFGVIAAIAWAATCLYFAGGHDRFDVFGYSLGQDFINVWIAGHMAAEGRAPQVFDPARFLEATRALFDPALPPHFWSYPPTALFTAAPLGGTGYFTGLVLWSAAGFLALAWAAMRFFPAWRDRLLLLASPAVAINLVMGQNGCLTATLWIGGMAFLSRRPALAGTLFGLLTFKPQLGLLLPPFLLAGRAWRAIALAALAAAALAAASVAAFGWESWRAFAALTLPTQSLSMSLWEGPFQWFMPSVFMAARLLGAAAPLAWAAQAPFTLLAAVLAWRAGRSGGDPQVRASLLFVATFVATPQSSAYDLIPLAAAAVVLARCGRGPADAVLAALLWAAPWAVLPLNAFDLPLIPLLTTWGALRLASLLEKDPQRSASPSADGVSLAV